MSRDVVRLLSLTNVYDHGIISWQAVAHGRMSDPDLRDILLEAYDGRLGSHRAPDQIDVLFDTASAYPAKTHACSCNTEA
ncbi:MAG: hypothetical protein MK160_01360 [Rhodobacteraceae bacterium]|nr:hypothetical protein [Paracoccaceae bacterium]